MDGCSGNEECRSMKPNPFKRGAQREFGWEDEPFRLVQETTVDNDVVQRETERKELDRIEHERRQVILPCCEGTT